MRSYPLTSLQQVMLLNLMTEPRSGNNIEQVATDFHEAVDAERLRESCRRVAARHEALRTSFLWEAGEKPLQAVAEKIEIPWSEEDWRAVSAEEEHRKWNELLEKDRARGFHPQEPPLMRLLLIHLPDGRDRLLWTFHHLLLDGRSIILVLREVLAVYQALEKGEEPRFQPSPPFEDFIQWLKERKEEGEEAFWREQFRGFEPPQPLREEGEKGGARLVVDAVETAVLERFAETHNVTVNTLLQAAWALVLSRHLDSEDVVFGNVRACRHWGGSEHKDSVGMFIHNVPSRLRVQGDMSVVEWLKVIRQGDIEARPYVFTPPDKIKEYAGLSKDTALFESTIMFERGSWTRRAAGDNPRWQKARVQIFEQSGLPFLLTGILDETLELELEYARFNHQAAQRMLGHVVEVLKNFSRSTAETKIGDVTILPSEERKWLEEWSGRAEQYPLDLCLHQLFEQRVSQQPDTIAVECGAEVLSYAELNARANRLAAHLRGLGVQAETLVGMSVGRSPWMIVGILGILKAGGAYVPIDPDYPYYRKRLIIKDAGLPIIISDAASAGSLPFSRAHVIALDKEWETMGGNVENLVDVAVKPGNAVSILYTSGSTGTPKGVVNLHRGIVNEVWDATLAFPLQPHDRVLQLSTVNFDAAMEEIFGTLLAGATLVFRDAGMLATYQQFNQGVKDKRVTVLDLTTAFWSRWVRYLEKEKLDLPPSLKTVVVGGEKTTATAYEVWQRVNKGRVRWINAYGPTETSIASAYFVSPDTSERQIPLKSVPIGEPLPNTRAYVLDSKQRLVPRGTRGELFIGGVGVGRGYLHQPELTERAFLPDPFSSNPAARLFRTGDAVRINEDGQLEYEGRLDFQVKVRGFRIELGEIEHALEKHHAISEAAVVAIKGKDEVLHLVAYVATKTPLTSHNLEVFLREMLPDFMVPRAFVFMPTFPLNANGKVDKKALLPPTFHADPVTNYEVSPSHEMEIKLAFLFGRVLKNDHMGVNDNFFQNGGDSLSSMELIEEAAKEGVKLSPQTIVQYSTARQLARHLLSSESADSQQWSPLVTLRAQGTLPPLFLVHATHGDVRGYGNLVQLLGEDQPCYGFASRNLFDDTKPHRTIEEMAQCYVERLLAFQPEDPYYLAGWCYGGTVAFEMAQQLLARGKKIALLALIECWASPPPGKIGWLRYKLRRAFCFCRMPFTRKMAYLKYKIMLLAGYPLEQIPDHIPLGRETMEEANRSIVHRQNMDAYWKYRGKKYDGPIDVLLSKNISLGIVTDPQACWPLHTKKARYHFFEATHDSILREPVVVPLAQTLKNLIQSKG
ncbi:MAG: amino acid adenylation domain-containing protein [bacterium]